MKTVMVGVLMFVASFFAFQGTAQAWDCTAPGQIRVQVPNGTTGNGQGDGSGQVDTVEGITFECEAPPTTPTDPTPTTSNSNSSSAASSNSASSSNASSGSNSGATSTSKATGGVATATGGNSNATGGTSSVNGSGNSSNTNKNVAQGGSGGSATQTQTQSSNSAASNNGNGSNDSSYTSNSSTTVEAPKIPVDTAYAPTAYPTVTCFKPLTGGAQTVPFGISLGGGSIDGGCDAREYAREYALLGSRLSACKLLVAQKRSKKAGVTLEDCLTVVKPPTPAIVQAPNVPQQGTNFTPNITVVVPAINVPAPVVTVIPPPVVTPKPSVAVAAKQNVVKHPTTPHVTCPCRAITNDNLTVKPKGS